MAILHAKLVWLSVATITTSFSIWLRLSIETVNQYSQNDSWLRLSIETLNHPPKTTIVSSPSLFVTVTNEVRDWPVIKNLFFNMGQKFKITGVKFAWADVEYIENTTDDKMAHLLNSTSFVIIQQMKVPETFSKLLWKSTHSRTP